MFNTYSLACKQFSTGPKAGGKPPGNNKSPIYGNFEAKDEGEAASMEEAKEFLNTAKQFVEELKDPNDWVTTVMQSEKPVILDCYAK